MNEVKVIGPLGGTSHYKTYPIDFIKAIDNNGNAVDLKVSPSIEIRFTDSSNRKTIFYFDLMQVHGDSIIGHQSRIITSIKKTILLSYVKKIEVQDGKKNFHYAEK